MSSNYHNRCWVNLCTRYLNDIAKKKNSLMFSKKRLYMKTFPNYIIFYCQIHILNIYCLSVTYVYRTYVIM